MILAIDPGLNGCGCALFRDSELAAADYIKNCCNPKNPRVNRWMGMGTEVYNWAYDTIAANGNFDVVVVEVPRVYPGVQMSDANDLLDLTGVLGAILGRFGSSTPSAMVYPAEWKGQVPKKIMNQRVLGKLSADELDRVMDAGAKSHNTIDAIGIGLYHLGRLGK